MKNLEKIRPLQSPRICTTYTNYTPIRPLPLKFKCAVWGEMTF